MILKHSFVEYIPEDIKEDKLYVSVENEIIVHKCCCGCGEKVFLPLSPVDWKFIFDGESITIDPSIGNWGMACKSHYWIKNGKIVWSNNWNQDQIDDCRINETVEHQRYFNSKKISFWSRIISFFKSNN
ncbi:DUF6527 family protein [Gramella sp. GC03-9]|uniref:DUF6527 family protein n=1 Tax=Christiangramia oceanisediminis TaxID=2920386 RepID=A0A9X2KXD1_9FLAO|nr:DUF6527 family protein [Gramella oceanisediminis]MCP9199246.1 DUF6527 family protein [Gramella oceanisediminis]